MGALPLGRSKTEKCLRLLEFSAVYFSPGMIVCRALRRGAGCAKPLWATIYASWAPGDWGQDGQGVGLDLSGVAGIENF